MKAYLHRILIAILLTLGLLILGGQVFPALPSSSMQSEAFWTNKAYPEEKYEVVLIGDSRIYRGLDPDTMAQEMKALGDLRMFNFGFSSAGLDSVFLEAGAALLDESAPRRIILLGITPSSLADENMANTHFHQERNRPTLELWQRKQINPYFSYFDPSRPSIIRNNYRGEQAGYYQEYKKNGWIASRKIPKDVWKDFWMVEQGFKKAAFSLFWRTKLIEKIAQWEQEGIDVVAFRPPAVAHFEKVEDEFSGISMPAVTAQIKGVGGDWIEIPDRYSYETYDGNHLEKSSALRLSAYLGQQMEAILDSTQNGRLILAASQNFEQASQQPWSEIATENLDPSKPFSGNYSQLLQPEQYSCTYEQKLDSLPFQKLDIRSSCRAKLKATKTNNQAVLVISVEDASGALLWKGEQLLQQCLDTSTWNYIHNETIYEHHKNGCVLKVYVWNKSTDLLWLDDLKVEVFSMKKAN